MFLNWIINYSEMKFGNRNIRKDWIIFEVFVIILVWSLVYRFNRFMVSLVRRVVMVELKVWKIKIFKIIVIVRVRYFFFEFNRMNLFVFFVLILKFFINFWLLIKLYILKISVYSVK